MAAPFVIGHDQNGTEVCLDYDNRRLSTYIIGRQGMGKSKLLLRMGLHDIEQGHGLSVITPDGDLIRDFLACIPSAHKDRVIVFDPTDMEFPVGLNIFSCADPTDDLLVGKIAGDVVTKTFELLWKDSWGYQMEQIMRLVSRTITRCQSMSQEDRPTLVEFSTMLTSSPFRDRYIEYIRGHFASREWKLLEWWDHFNGLKPQEREERIRSTLNKTDKFAEQPTLANIFGQAQGNLNLRQIMDEQHILLVDLSKGAIGQENSYLMGAVLVGQFYLAAISRADIPEQERKPFHLIVDEFQNFATDAFFDLHEEARKYAIDTVIAHQNLSQLPPVMQDRALGAGVKIVLQVTGKDAERLAGEFDATPPPPEISHRQPEYALSVTPWTELKKGGGQDETVRNLVEGITWAIENSNLVRRIAIPLNQMDRELNEQLDEDIQRALNDYFLRWMKREEVHPILVFRDFLSRKVIPQPLLLAKTSYLYWVIGKYATSNDYGVTWDKYEDDEGISAVNGYFLDEIEEIHEGSLKLISEHDNPARFEAFRAWVRQTPYRSKQLSWVLNDTLGLEYPLSREKRACEFWYDNTKQRVEAMEAFWKPLIWLGKLLQDKPIYSPSVYHQPVLEKPRSYDDVRNEHANNLKKLERFHAWVSFPDGSEYHNVSLLRANDCGDNEEIRTYIRDHSRASYGRDRGYVEAMIAKRRQLRPLPQINGDEVPPPR